MWLTVLAALQCGAFVGAEPPTDRPNVIAIMSDDQWSVALGCYGSAELVTPHTDALAARGVRFTQFHAGAASTGNHTVSRRNATTSQLGRLVRDAVAAHRRVSHGTCRR